MRIGPLGASEIIIILVFFSMPIIIVFGLISFLIKRNQKQRTLEQRLSKLERHLND